MATAVTAPPDAPSSADARPRRVVLAGNPNVGKSTLFNALTGLHQRVTNYPGVTVERKLGRVVLPGGAVTLIDLPGSYSLVAASPDEAVVHAELHGRIGDEGAPDLVVLVLDAAHLERNLHLALQVLDLGLPSLIALNQVDAAAREQVTVDDRALARLLGVPVIRTVGRSGEGVEALLAAVDAGGAVAAPPPMEYPPAIESAAAALAAPLAGSFEDEAGARRRLPAILGSAGRSAELAATLPADLAARLAAERDRVEALGVDPATATAEARYRIVDAIAAEVVRRPLSQLGWQERLDRVFTHRISGSLILLSVFVLLFESIFTWSAPMMDGVDGLMANVGDLIAGSMAPGLVRDFAVEGLVAGFAGVLVFVPQILVMFLIVNALDDTGYLARAAFLLDRLMGGMGLPGRAFLPLVSSFVCAIPGVMATRNIANPRDRMATMFAAPFMSCSARLPVYLMVIGALFKGTTVLGGRVSAGTVIMASMYLLGIAAGLATAGLLRRTVLRGGRSPLLLELPAYRWPVPRTLVIGAARRTWQFVSQAGPVILVLSIVLWGLAAFPRDPVLDRDYDALRVAAAAAVEADPGTDRDAALAARLDAIDRQERGDRMSKSHAGRLGKLIEPAIEPLGMDWKMGIGLVASFAAREVFVSTLGIVYAAGEGESDDGGEQLLDAIRNDVDPDTGEPVFRPLVGLSLLVFFVLAMQCMSTLAVVKRETGGWRWPLAMLVWMTTLAWVGSFLTYQIGTALGY